MVMGWKCAVRKESYDGEVMRYIRFQDGPDSGNTHVNSDVSAPGPDGSGGDSDDGCADLRVSGQLREPYLPEEQTDVVCRQSFPPRRHFSAFILDGLLFTLGGYEGPNSYGSDMWYRDSIPPKTLITTVPRDQQPETKFQFSCDEVACSFECRFWDHWSGYLLRNWSRCASPFDAFGINSDKRATRFEVRATDAAGNRDDNLLPFAGYSTPSNVYIWTYVPPIPWLLIGLIVGFIIILFLILLYLYRRYLRQKALKRYLEKRAARRLRRARQEEEERMKAQAKKEGRTAKVAPSAPPESPSKRSTIDDDEERKKRNKRSRRVSRGWIGGLMRTLDRWGIGTGGGGGGGRRKVAPAPEASNTGAAAAAAASTAITVRSPLAAAAAANKSASGGGGGGARFTWGRGSGDVSSIGNPLAGTTTTTATAGGRSMRRIAPVDSLEAGANGQSSALVDANNNAATAASGGGGARRRFIWSGAAGDVSGQPHVRDTRAGGAGGYVSSDARRGDVYSIGGSPPAGGLSNPFAGRHAYNRVSATPVRGGGEPHQQPVLSANVNNPGAALLAQSGQYTTNARGVRVPVAPVLPARLVKANPLQLGQAQATARAGAGATSVPAAVYVTNAAGTKGAAVNNRSSLTSAGSQQARSGAASVPLLGNGQVGAIAPSSSGSSGFSGGPHIGSLAPFPTASAAVAGSSSASNNGNNSSGSRPPMASMSGLDQRSKMAFAPVVGGRRGSLGSPTAVAAAAAIGSGRGAPRAGVQSLPVGRGPSPSGTNNGRGRSPIVSAALGTLSPPSSSPVPSSHLQQPSAAAVAGAAGARRGVSSSMSPGPNNSRAAATGPLQAAPAWVGDTSRPNSLSPLGHAPRGSVAPGLPRLHHISQQFGSQQQQHPPANNNPYSPAGRR